jgi:heme-degrading monooxygenase HmoA
MIAVLFEAWPAEGQGDRYLAIAAALGSELAAIDGFLGIERFESLSEPGKLLSLSWWRDEAAIAAWRGFGPHRAAQAEGRAAIFRDYRIRVAAVVRGYGMLDRTGQL